MNDTTANRLLNLAMTWTRQSEQYRIRANQLGPGSAGLEKATEASMLLTCSEDLARALTAAPDGMTWTTGNDQVDRRLRTALEALDALQDAVSAAYIADDIIPLSRLIGLLQATGRAVPPAPDHGDAITLWANQDGDPAGQAERDRLMSQACGQCGGEVPADGEPVDHFEWCPEFVPDATMAKEDRRNAWQHAPVVQYSEPTYDQLRTFAGNVAACMPGENDDPSSEDQEALTDLAEEAQRLLGISSPPEPGTPEQLWIRVKGIIRADGSWPGGDLVPVIDGWLTRHGIDTSWVPKD